MEGIRQLGRIRQEFHLIHTHVKLSESVVLSVLSVFLDKKQQKSSHNHYFPQEMKV
jgi:hypothetical protein